MAFSVKVEPTLTGGTDVDLVPSGTGTGKYVYPGGSRLERTAVDLVVSQKGNAARPVASTGLRVTDTHVAESEGCCSVAADQTVFDLGIRYPLMSGLTDVEVGAALDRFLAVVNSAGFRASVLTGILPA